MTAFEGGRADWDRLGLAGSLTLSPDAAAAARRAGKLVEYAISFAFFTTLIVIGWAVLVVG